MEVHYGHPDFNTYRSSGALIWEEGNLWFVTFYSDGHWLGRLTHDRTLCRVGGEDQLRERCGAASQEEAEEQLALYILEREGADGAV